MNTLMKLDGQVAGFAPSAPRDSTMLQCRALRVASRHDELLTLGLCGRCALFRALHCASTTRT